MYSQHVYRLVIFSWTGGFAIIQSGNCFFVIVIVKSCQYLEQS